MTLMFNYHGLGVAGGEGAAANTANKRVLVTNRDGSQSVQTIHNELGMRAGDREDARRRLAAQGIDAAEIGMHAGVDNRDKSARNPRGNPALSRTTGGMGVPQGRAGGNSNAAATFNPRAEFTRHAAAAKLAAAYRGRKGRLEAGYERKKQEAEGRARAEEELEQNRPKARQLTRPKGNSYIGF